MPRKSPGFEIILTLGVNRALHLLGTEFQKKKKGEWERREAKEEKKKKKKKKFYFAKQIREMI